jgi:hypothetical protein
MISSSSSSSSRAVRPVALLIAALLAFVCAVVVQPTIAGAADNGNFSIDPTAGQGAEPRTYLIYNLDPGAQIQDSVTISNFTDAPITFDLYASDTQPTADGGFALGNPDDPTSGVGAWILLPTKQITVPAKMAAAVPFQLVVPSDATAGDHAGGIVALNTASRETDQVSNEGNLDIGARDGVATRVYLRVTGEALPSLQVSSVSLAVDGSIGSKFGAPADGVVTYKVVNTGNVRLAPTATVKVAGPFGLGGTTLEPRQLPELLPGASALITQPVDGVYPLGWQTASVSVSATDAEGTVVSSSGSSRAIVIPWLLLLLIALLIVGFVLIRRRGRQGPAPVSGSGEPTPPVDAMAGVS